MGRARKGVSEALAAALVLSSIIILLLPLLLGLPKVIAPKPPSLEARTLFTQAAAGYAMQNLMNVYAVLINSSGSLLLRIELVPRTQMVIDSVYVWSPPHLAKIAVEPKLPVKIAPGARIYLEANVTSLSDLLSRGIATLVICTESGAIIRAPIVSASTLQKLLSTYTAGNTTPSYAYTLLSGSILSKLSNENLTQSLSTIFYIGNVTTQQSQLLAIPTKSNPGTGMKSNYPLKLMLDLKNVTIWSGYIGGWGNPYITPMNSNMLFVAKSSNGKYILYISTVNYESLDADTAPSFNLGYCTSTGCNPINLYYYCKYGARVKIIGFKPLPPPLNSQVVPSTLWYLLP